MARFRHSLSGASAACFVGDRTPDSGVVTVADFHRECIRISAKLKAARDSSGVLSLSPGEIDAA